MKQHCFASGSRAFVAALVAPVFVVAALAVWAGAAGKNGGEKFDPVKVNGKFFEDWPKPDLAILFSGRLDGYLEPCGCAGLENQKGGVSRRHSLIKQLERDRWPLLSVDVGGLVRRPGRQAEIKFGASVEALKTMKYRGVGFGPDDLRLESGEVAAAIAGEDVDSSIFVAANVGVLGVTPQVKIIELGGHKIGITSVLGSEFQQAVNNPDIELKPAAESLKPLMPKFEGCDIKILLANATLEESTKLAKKFPQFNIVVTAGGGDEPPYRAAMIEGTKTRLIEVGHKGMYAVVLGFYPDQPFRYQRVALDSRFPGTPEMKQLMVSYQQQLQALGWQGLGLRPVPHPRGKGHDKSWGTYAGVESCRECHASAYKVWENSKHAHATQTLAKLDPPRQYDPECISCHATGWNPQEFFPYATGFVSVKETPQLASNTCENCHGPGAAHVAAERGPAKKDRAELREAMAVSKDNLCIKCHDLDNDPVFNLDTYWPQIEH